jgi:hypothetical protein
MSTVSRLQGGGGAVTGNSTIKVAPPPTSLRTSIDPPWSSTIRFTIARPSPARPIHTVVRTDRTRSDMRSNTFRQRHELINRRGGPDASKGYGAKDEEQCAENEGAKKVHLSVTPVRKRLGLRRDTHQTWRPPLSTERRRSAAVVGAGLPILAVNVPSRIPSIRVDREKLNEACDIQGASSDRRPLRPSFAGAIKSPHRRSFR